MRKGLTLLVTGLISAVLGVLALVGVVAAITTTDAEAAKAAPANAEPQFYGSR